MKIAKVTTFYPDYLKNFYGKRLHLVQQPYREQKQALDKDAFGWSDFWEKALIPLGYEVMEVIANAETLQKSWAKENNIDFAPATWQHQVVCEQIRAFKPTILFLEDYSVIPPLLLKELKQDCSSIRLVLSWCGAPYNDPSAFKFHDHVLSCIPELVDNFQSLGLCSHHINHAFDPRILERVDLKSQPKIDFSFVGQIIRSNQYHQKREKLLERIATQLPIKIYSPMANASWQNQFKQSLQLSAYQIIRSLEKIGIPASALNKFPKIGKYAEQEGKPRSAINPELKPYLYPAVFGLNMFQVLRNSKITLNCHIDISPHSASNMRLFETTGVGSCLITDWKDNLHTLFEPDREVVTYRSADECVEKVKWLLENPKQRNAIAKAGQKRTLKDHTFKQRAIQLDQIIREKIGTP